MTNTNTITNSPELLNRAFFLGMDAFKRGALRAPAADVAYMQLVRELARPGTSEGFRAGSELADQFLKGWDHANLTAPMAPDAGTITERSTTAEATHFRGNPKFGRTTTLKAANGAVLIVVMGAVSRRDAFRAWQNEQAKKTAAREAAAIRQNMPALTGTEQFTAAFCSKS